MPHVSFDDCGPYVRWLFDHPDRADDLDLSRCVMSLVKGIEGAQVV